MLENGSQGEEVTALQKSLMTMGINPGSTDGVYGPSTDALVKPAGFLVGPKTPTRWAGPNGPPIFVFWLAVV